ncbi:E3 ubiquitin-protein ligase At1g12760-like isoform X2 [Vigna umbellata]|uniref:E3 ubiquitin-protein ligase At1g12760-like isoform X2 n=1 Tax=Vigna umbellata TaxID=87088 RepID=UPI001F5EE48C|nr:E3 ubiquitin-protein ligase At1g12760-like isoform X2 [Vigna umbellata]
MDQGQRHVSATSATNSPVLRCTTVCTLPFARLVAASRRRLFLSDCADGRSDDDDGAECGYSRAVLVLDMVWNLAFVVVAAGVLLSTLSERPSTPLRLWLCGYAFECVLHMTFVFFEFRVGVRDSFAHTTYWLTVVFLAFDIFFIIFCIGMACVVFFALFCIIPIIALAYAMKIREGASEEDIRSLPMYMFSQSNSLVMVDDNKKQLVNTKVDSCNGSHMSELSLNPDDSECCICLCPYADGAEVYRLPCTHHFHCECIGRWLRSKATCPLCKFNILRGDTLV